MRASRFIHSPHFVSEVQKHRIGLYRDDGLACFGDTSGPQADRIRKDFIKIFKENFDFSITSERNLKAVNFVNVTLNLTTDKYQPYNKADDNPLYINILYKHPPNVIKKWFNPPI